MDAMRTCTLVLALALSIGVAACTQRPFTVECVGPGFGLLPGECEEVADEVAARVGPQLLDFGRLMVVSVELVDCDAQGIAPPGSDRCWNVELDFESGGMGLLASRDARTGEIRISQ
jgi:hypothetical protein